MPEKFLKCFVPKCDAHCEKLQKGACDKLTLDEIIKLLDKTEWNDMDKEDLLTPYILKNRG